jgi:hypothetical protein
MAQVGVALETVEARENAESIHHKPTKKAETKISSAISALSVVNISASSITSATYSHRVSEPDAQVSNQRQMV